MAVGRHELHQPVPEERTDTLPEFDESLAAVRARVVRVAGTKVAAGGRSHEEILSLLQWDAARKRQLLARPQMAACKPAVFDQPLHARRLNIMNAVFLALEEQRCLIKARGITGGEISARIGTTYVALRVEPVTGPAPAIVRKCDSEAPLQISVIGAARGEKVIASDTTANPLEELLSKAVVDILVFGEAEYRAVLRRTYRQRQVRHRASIAEATRVAEAEESERKKRRSELAGIRVSELLRDAADLQRARMVREYVADVRNAFLIRGEMPGDRVEEWAMWALQQADEIDPVLSLRFLTGLKDAV